MSEFFALSLEEVCERIEAPVAHVNILSHARPDGDTLGSAAALCLYFTAMGRTVSLLCGDKIPARLGFLTEGLALLPPKEDCLTLAVDVASPIQLGALCDAYRDKVDLIIDHHEAGAPFAPAYIKPHAAAAGEIVFEILTALAERGGPAINAEIAARLYAAITSDTGGFRYANTTPNTHRVAAELLGYGIRADLINHALFVQKSPELLAAEQIALQNLHAAAGGRIAYTVITRASRGDLAEEHFETAIDIARSRAGAEIAFSLRERETGEFRASLRAVDADVAAVAVRLGGGGHLRAAGCTVPAESAEEAVKILLPLLEGALK